MIYLRHFLISYILSQDVTCSYTHHQEPLQVDTHHHKVSKGNTHHQYTLQVVTDCQENLHTIKLKKTLQVVSHHQDVISSYKLPEDVTSRCTLSWSTAECMFLSRVEGQG